MAFQDLDADVIILGAGVAGMATAHYLLEKEPTLTILILEATDRIGGRVFSKIPETGATCEYGGVFMSSQQTQLIKLLKDLEIVIERRSLNGKIIVDSNGKVFKQKPNDPFGFADVTAKLELAKFVSKVEEICNRRRLEPEESTLSMQTFIEKHLKRKTNRAILEMTILVNCGLHPKEITLEFYIFFCISTYGITNQLSLNQKGLREYFIPNGADLICKTIETQEDVTIKKNIKVVKIRIENRFIEITSKKEKFYGNVLVVTAPPSNILKIDFSPPLPQFKINSLKNATPGILSKFILSCEEPFWKNVGYCGDIYNLNRDDNNPVICCFDSSTNKKAALSGFCTSEDTSLILEQMAHYFGGRILTPAHFSVKKWTGSPMFCYRSLLDIRRIQTGTNRLFWAGAETSLEWYGTICGAVISGKRAAYEVLYDLRPALLSVADMDLFDVNLATVQRRLQNHNTFYSKLVSPFYQVSTLILVVFAIMLWKKKNSIKQLLIK